VINKIIESEEAVLIKKSYCQWKRDWYWYILHWTSDYLWKDRAMAPNYLRRN